MQIIPSTVFKKAFKKLHKKYPSLKGDLEALKEELEKNGEVGKSLGQGFYKIRLAIKSKGGGKRGGARVITLVQKKEGKLFLLALYDKSDRDTISETELNAIVKSLN